MLSPIKTASIVAFTLLDFIHLTSAQMNAMTAEGCYSSPGDMTDQGSYMYQTATYCQPICVGLGKAVMGLTKGSNCWCGDLLPAASAKIDASQCNAPCNGFGTQNCGGNNAWTVLLSGLSNNVANIGGSLSSASPSASLPSSVTSSQSNSPSTTLAPPVVITIPPSIITVGGSTVVRTIPGYTSTQVPQGVAAGTDPSASSSSSSGSSTNTAGIAAGVVVGVVALVAIIAGGIFYMRKRNRAVETTSHRRNASLHAFAAEPGNGARTTSDTRLDPRIMVERRHSGGSVFADNQDYSRRILQVANPDVS